MVALAPCQSRPRSIRKETCGKTASSNIPMAAPIPHRHRIRKLFIWVNWATGQYHYAVAVSSKREPPPDKPVASLTVFTQSLPRSATDLLLITFTHTLSLEIHLGGHFGKFPYLGPFNSPIPIFSARKPIEDQLAKIASLSSQHKLPREGLRRCKETETGISNDADAFKGHQRSHYVSEICGKAKRIFVHHFCEIIGQLFEIDFPEFQIQVVLKQSLDYGSDSFRVYSRLQEIQIQNVLAESVNVAADNMKKRIDHLRLQLRGDSPDHAEVKESEMTTVHYQQISRMWISMKEAVFQQLFQVSAHQQSIYFYG